MNSLKTIQEFSRTPENIQGQQDVFQGSTTKQVLTANSRTILGAQGRLATLNVVKAHIMISNEMQVLFQCVSCQPHRQIVSQSTFCPRRY